MEKYCAVCPTFLVILLELGDSAPFYSCFEYEPFDK